jgi:tryptophan synthase beta chain
LTRGSYQYDFGDTGQMAPLIKMHTLGHDFIPDPIHAGGLRYHGMAPLVSHLKEIGLIEATALNQTETFARAVEFARVEGILPGPEPTHAVAEAMNEAERAKEAGEEKVILFNLCGHGHFDMSAYDAYFAGKLVDYEYPTERVAEAMARVPAVTGW